MEEEDGDRQEDEEEVESGEVVKMIANELRT